MSLSAAGTGLSRRLARLGRTLPPARVPSSFSGAVGSAEQLVRGRPAYLSGPSAIVAAVGEPAFRVAGGPHSDVADLITTPAGTLGSFRLESHTEHRRSAEPASAPEEHERRAATGAPR